MHNNFTEQVKNLCKESITHLCALRMTEIVKIVFEQFKDVNPQTFCFSGRTIAQKLGIKVIPYSNFTKEHLKTLQSFNTSYWQDGICISQNNIKAIYYKDQNSCNKEEDDFITEFIINHELAHLILEHTEQCSLAEEEATFFSGTMSIFMLIAKVLQEQQILTSDLIKKLLVAYSNGIKKQKEVQCD